MKKTPDKIVIFGQYKSGTTALFTKIRNSLPPNTRTLFEPLEYIPESADSDRWVLSKKILKFPGHPQSVNYESFLDFDRKIYLTRDPRDWLISATLFLVQEKTSVYTSDSAMQYVMDYLHQKEKQPRSMPLKKLLEYILIAPPAISLEVFCKRTQGLHEWCFEFEKNLQDLFRLKYEDFVDGDLKSLEEYLEISLCGNTDIDEVYNHVIRTKSYGNWRDWLVEEDIIYFKPFFDPYICQYGYSSDWSLNDSPVIHPEYGSKYVTRVVHKKRERINK